MRPQIEIAPGERQFWRLVNASADRYLDLQLEGQTFEIVAMDRMPIAQHDPNHRTRSADHVLSPPAGRLEAVVTGPAAGTPRRLISRCVDTGPDGDPNPAMVLADIVPQPAANTTSKVPENWRKTDLKTLDLGAEEKVPPRFIVTFTEDKKGFLHQRRKIHARCRSDGALQGWFLSALENRQCNRGTASHAHPSSPLPGVRRKRPTNSRTNVAGHSGCSIRRLR